ncbi:MAG: preprotein translocase subunit YajC [Gammaproteobacteria bacterium]|nr:preprotein translocase subunit YajC [Gammaproteobacteria bacterium]
MSIVTSLFNAIIPSASAADATPAAAQAQSGTSFFVMMGVLFFFMYFVLIRPQSKRAKEQRNLIGALAKGDEVVTAGGILGKITKISDSYITLALNDNVEVTVQKASVSGLLPKGTLKSI